MGVRKIFQPGQADFSGITDQEDLYVSSFRHSAVIQVDEKGLRSVTKIRRDFVQNKTHVSF